MTELRTILLGSKNLTHGKESHVLFPSHLFKNIQGLHLEPKLPLNRNVLHGQNRAAHAQETSAESSDTSRVAQASEQGSPVKPQQPPRLRARQRITSDLGLFTKRIGIHPHLQGTQILRSLQIVLGCMSILISIAFSTTEQKTSTMVSTLFTAPTQHSCELQGPVQWAFNPQLETLLPLLSGRVPH